MLYQAPQPNWFEEIVEIQVVFYDHWVIDVVAVNLLRHPGLDSVTEILHFFLFCQKKEN
jgi:hypothetical protein